jgi:hypothetical protein
MIRINLDRAKLIAHDVRRAERAREFEPHDRVIALQIPGQDHNAAEAARAEIRARYDVFQQQIDDATSADELKAIIEVMRDAE